MKFCCGGDRENVMAVVVYLYAVSERPVEGWNLNLECPKRFRRERIAANSPLPVRRGPPRTR